MFEERQDKCIKEYQSELPSEHLKQRVMSEYKARTTRPVPHRKVSVRVGAGFAAAAACLVLTVGTWMNSGYTNPSVTLRSMESTVEENDANLSPAAFFETRRSVETEIPLSVHTEQEVSVSVSSGYLRSVDSSHPNLSQEKNVYRLSADEDVCWVIEPNTNEPQLILTYDNKEEVYELFFDQEKNIWQLKTKKEKK